MQNRIFALWGIGGTGKTTTLKLVARDRLNRLSATHLVLLMRELCGL